MEQRRLTCYEYIRRDIDDMEYDRKVYGRGDAWSVAESEYGIRAELHLAKSLNLVTDEEYTELFYDFMSAHLGYDVTTNKRKIKKLAEPSAVSAYQLIKKNIDEMEEYRKICDGDEWDIVMYEFGIDDMLDLASYLGLLNDTEFKELDREFCAKNYIG